MMANDFLSRVKDCSHIPEKVFVQNSCSEKLQLAYNLLVSRVLEVKRNS